MSLQYIFFDLDGTLLPMDQNRFIKAYFSHLAAKLAPKGIDEKALVETIWGGTKAMVANDGSRTNEEVFWDHFVAAFGPEIRKDQATFDDFYRNEFQLAQSACGFDPRAAQTVAELKARGFTLGLATNPIFPAIATESRIRWAGLNKDDFILRTTYENSRHCKPNPHYYRDILNFLGAEPAQCLMVGNDATEDMVAEKLGMKVFLLTDCLINAQNRELSGYPQGSFPELMAYLDQPGR
jgi:FMN phosphatase YigB (HAD superfamily)